MGNLRNYIVNVNDVLPYGMSVTGKTESYNMTIAFSGTSDYPNDDNLKFDYKAITLDDIRYMSDVDYENRIKYFLSFIGNIDLSARYLLLSKTNLPSDDCPDTTNNVCTLNADFTIYKPFADYNIIRIINIGSVSGTAQYRIYENNTAPSMWSNNNQYTIMPNKLYAVEVREIINGNVNCQVKKLYTLN